MKIPKIITNNRNDEMTLKVQTCITKNYTVTIYNINGLLKRHMD